MMQSNMSVWMILRIIIWLVYIFFPINKTPAQEPIEPAVDLVTLNLVPKNVGNKYNGAGCCVTSACQGCLNSQVVKGWEGFREYHYNSPLGGGASPDKVSKLVEGYAKANNLPPLRYIQVEGPDTARIIQEAITSGRAVASTDGGSTAFYGWYVPHMTNITAFSDDRVGIVDNNRPTMLETISRAEWEKRHNAYGRWCIVFLDLPVLPVPHNHNRKTSMLEAVGLYTMLMEPMQWGGNSCNVVQSVQQQEMQYYWLDNHDGTFYLTDKTGSYRYGMFKNGSYYDMRGTPVECPVANPVPSNNDIGQKLPSFVFNGVDPLNKNESKCTKNGKVISIESAIADIQTDGLGDTTKPSIVLNGKVYVDLWNKTRETNTEVQKLHEYCKIYSVDNPAMQRFADAHGYGQGITVLTSCTNGHADDIAYLPNEKKLDTKKLFGAISKADPNYKPGNGKTDKVEQDYTGAIWIGLACLLAFVFLPPNKPKQVVYHDGMDSR